jgi:thymidylate kinase
VKILILEGIATSGKSTVTDTIREHLSGLAIRVVSEAETHVPIMKQTNELHVTFFKSLINQSTTMKSDLIIFDRLYLTQAFRAGVSLAEYSDLENMLSGHGALTVFLKVDERAIAERVAKAAEHREPSWGEYIKTKGATNSEIANYYITQQRNQMKLLDTSALPYMVCDTTRHNYAETAQTILEELRLT